MGLAHLTTDIRDEVTVVTARDGLFDAISETDMSAPLAAEVVAELRSAIVGAAAVLVDLRRAGKVNVRALSVAFQLAHELKRCGIPGALCGSTDLNEIWDMCRGGTVCNLYADLEEAYGAVGRAL